MTTRIPTPLVGFLVLGFRVKAAAGISVDIGAPRMIRQRSYEGPYGWLSKLGSLFGCPKYEVPYYIKENYPYMLRDLGVRQFRNVPRRSDRIYALSQVGLQESGAGRLCARRFRWGEAIQGANSR